MYAILLISLLDGSSVNLKVPQGTVIDFRTEYGALKIPVNHLKMIELGVHVDDEKPYREHVAKLGSPNYRDRAAAKLFLEQNSRMAFKFLPDLLQEKDQEVRNNVTKLLAKYKTKPVLIDSINMESGRFEGYLQGTSIKGECDALGKLDIRFSQVASMRATLQIGSKLIDCSGNWIPVGYVNGGRISITASGTVDLWPETPSWEVKACGHSTQNGGWPAGALLGRINGRIFFIGEFYSSISTERGTLEMMINPGPWVNKSVGGYEIRVD